MSIIDEHIKQEVTTLATLWKITRRDGVRQGFTDHDSDIVYQDVIYISSTGILPSAIAKNDTLAVDNMEVQGVLNASGITEHDLSMGKYNGAVIYIMRINYSDLSQQSLYLQRGTLGEVVLSGDQFTVEIRGLTQKLQKGNRRCLFKGLPSQIW